MKGKHIAFCLEQMYGHIMPTLGITLELVRRGHRVSYAVTEHFAPLIRQILARPMIIVPLETRTKMIASTIKENDHLHWSVNNAEFWKVHKEVSLARTSQSLSQLEYIYRDDVPDAIIHDDCLDTAGRDLASKWGIAKIRHHSQFIDDDFPMERFAGDDIVLMTVPKFFQTNHAFFDRDRRFSFIGFLPEGRKQVLQPWKRPKKGTRPILISATTGLLPQVEFCKTMMDMFRNQPWDAVLSISGSHDALSAIDTAQFSDIPNNVILNCSSANFEILEDSCLYIGQGGQGGTLEAMYCGVPQILMPPTPYHYSVARRVSELGLGDYLPISGLSQDSLITKVATILRDKDTLDRVRAASNSMRSQLGAKLAVDTIEGYLSGKR